MTPLDVLLVVLTALVGVLLLVGLELLVFKLTERRGDHDHGRPPEPWP